MARLECSRRIPVVVVSSPIQSMSVPCMLTVPFSGPSVSADTRTRSPPILRARPLATIRPSPRPSVWRDREVSSREKAEKSCGRNQGDIPGPSSRTSISTIRASSLNVLLNDTSPESVNFIALLRRELMAFAKDLSSTIIQWISVCSPSYLHSLLLTEDIVRYRGLNRQSHDSDLY